METLHQHDSTQYCFQDWRTQVTGQKRSEHWQNAAQIREGSERKSDERSLGQRFEESHSMDLLVSFLPLSDFQLVDDGVSRLEQGLSNATSLSTLSPYLVE